MPPHTAARHHAPTVDVLVVTHNSAKWLDGLLEGLRRTQYPHNRIRLLIVDNASRDGTVAQLRQRADSLPFAVAIIETGTNTGFAGGQAVAFAHASGDYWLVLNPDTQMQPDAIGHLVHALEADDRAGIAEGRQSPREHPKYYDPFTRETSWCSGACMMVRPAAVQETGGFDPRFFMYAEDVDLSWRMWLHGWKCLYVPEAVVEHFTEDLDPTRKPHLQHYYSMRNGAVMRVLYGRAGEIFRHYAAMLRVATLGRAPLWHRWGTLRGLAASLPLIPAALRKRAKLPRGGRHPWVFFNGWEYGRHGRDVSLANPRREELPRGKPLLTFADFQQAALDSLEQMPDAPLDLLPCARLGSVVQNALVTHRAAALTLHVPTPAIPRLTGEIGIPPQPGVVRGRFVIEQDSQVVYQVVLGRAMANDGQWLPFGVELQPRDDKRPSALTLRFISEGGTTWGFWSNLCLDHVPPAVVPFAAVPAKSPCRISVVIPTHNRADLLQRVVGRLLAQPGAPPVEVIVVDSRSTDQTSEVLARLAVDSRVHPYRCAAAGAAAARNLGLDQARGDLVVLLDDDILVSAQFLAQLWQAHVARPDHVLLARIVAPWEGTVQPFLRYLQEAEEVNTYNFPDPDHVPGDYFYTGCVAIPRSVLGAARFDEGFKVYGVEDIDFGLRLLRGETRMAFLGDLQVWHEYAPELAEFCRKKALAGYSLGYLLSKKPWLADRFVFQPWCRKYHGLIRAALTLTSPLARLAECWEHLAARTGPLSRFLYYWYRASIRIQMYRGMLRFGAERAPSPAAAEGAGPAPAFAPQTLLPARRAG